MGHPKWLEYSNALQIQFLQQFVDGQSVMRGNVFQDAGKSSSFDGLVRGNDFVILAIQLGGHPHVRALLASDLISKNAENASQLRAIDVAREFH